MKIKRARNSCNLLHQSFYSQTCIDCIYFSYSTNARKRSILLRNQPLPPLDTAIHWIEHVLQFKGASHLKNAGAELKFYQYLLLDVAAFLLGCITVILTILYVSVKKLFAWCRPQRHYTGLSTKKIKKQV